MKSYRKSFFSNDLYNEKIASIKSEKNISTTTDCFKFLIDFYIKERNKKRDVDNNNEKNITDEKLLEELQYIKRKLNGIDFNTLIELHMLSDISDSDQVMERYMVPLGQSVNKHYERARENARHYLANRREL
ncbi:hypothetical protein [Staphylococcus caprae]|uniref:hypothetical protein n=1 Tax=Staphylococcus caprae TaxID=29380 RepID=UPI000CD0B8A9|nr:hypothetical protein [Staphylococcus caprae]POA06092.1 hypothetical protein CD155_03870 [Staphylococcus caprae]SUL89818.1 Uncharacterised protein [Staphylococcus caprae]